MKTPPFNSDYSILLICSCYWLLFLVSRICVAPLLRTCRTEQSRISFAAGFGDSSARLLPSARLRLPLPRRICTWVARWPHIGIGCCSTHARRNSNRSSPIFICFYWQHALHSIGIVTVSDPVEAFGTKIPRHLSLPLSLQLFLLVTGARICISWTRTCWSFLALAACQCKVLPVRLFASSRA